MAEQSVKCRRNSWRKTRSVDEPYYQVTDHRSGFVYKVLKMNADPRKDYASAMCLVTSPYTGPSGDMGDTYVTEIPGLVKAGVRAHDASRCQHCGEPNH